MSHDANELTASAAADWDENSSCRLRHFCHRGGGHNFPHGRISMGPSAKSLRELIFTMPGLRIYGNIGFTLKSLQYEAKAANDPSSRQKALIQLVCEPAFTEFLRSLADMQDKFGEPVYAEVKLTSQGKGGATRLDVFTGRIDLASQIRNNILDEDPMLPVTLRIRLVHVVGGDSDSARVGCTFGQLTMATIGELIQKAFDDE